MPSEPSRRDALGCGASPADAAGGASTGDVLEKIGGRHKEQVAGDRAAEIEDAVVIAGRLADEHVFEHLLDCGRRPRVANEIGAEFTLADLAERHVVADDLFLFAVLDNLGQLVMGKARLGRGVEFDVGRLGAADDPFLRFGRQCVPGGEVVQVFLHDHIAAAGEVRVLVPDQGGVERRLAVRVFGAVDKSQQVALVEKSKAVNLVCHGDGVCNLVHDLARQFEAQIHAVRPDVKEDVAWGGDRMARAGAKFVERVQFGRARRTEQPVPNFRPERDDAGQPPFEVAEPDRTQQIGDVGAERAHRGLGLRPGLDRYDEKDRGRCERPRHHLRRRTRLPRPPRRAAHSIVSVGSCPRARPARPAPLRPRPCDRRRVRARARCAIAVAARRRQPAADDRRARMIASRPSCHRQSTAAKPAPRIVSSWVSIPPISPKRS